MTEPDKLPTGLEDIQPSDIILPDEPDEPDEPALVVTLEATDTAVEVKTIRFFDGKGESEDDIYDFRPVSEGADTSPKDFFAQVSAVVLPKDKDTLQKTQENDPAAVESSPHAPQAKPVPVEKEELVTQPAQPTQPVPQA